MYFKPQKRTLKIRIQEIKRNFFENYLYSFNDLNKMKECFSYHIKDLLRNNYIDNKLYEKLNLDALEEDFS